MANHTNNVRKPAPRLTGYARVSTEDQNLDLQVRALEGFGIEPQRICTDKMTGAKMKRPGLQKAIDISRDGDTLVVYKLDRLGRSLKGVLEVIELLEKYGVQLKSLTEPIDSTTPVGRMMLNMLLSFAQMERDLISERTKAGMAAKRERGETTGPKHFVKDYPKRLARFTELWAAGEIPERTLGLAPELDGVEELVETLLVHRGLVVDEPAIAHKRYFLLKVF